MPQIEMALVHESSPTSLIGGVLYWVMLSTYLIAFDNMTKNLCYVNCSEETHDDLFKCNFTLLRGGMVVLALPY
jgi:hypothetical protein